MSQDQDGSGRGIYGQLYNADGTPNCGEFQINDEVYANQMYPSASNLSGEGYAVAWPSAFQDGYLDGIYIKIWGRGAINPDNPDQSTDENLYPYSPLYITTQSAVEEALLSISEAIQKKDQIRASLGAIHNRLENTINNLGIQKERLQSSESRISDVDFAQKMTKFTNVSIKDQTGIAMLSQANSHAIVFGNLNIG